MSSRLLDVWAHIVPPKYFERVDSLLSGSGDGGGIQHVWLHEFPALVDLDLRWHALDGIDDYQQILTLAVPPIEELGDREVCSELARLANDEMAELVRSHDRFAGFAAALPLGDVDASMEELERAMHDLGALGVQIYSNVAGHPIDDPRFGPVFAKVADLRGAIWLHPARGEAIADYATESSSRFGLWWALGWPYETSLAMARLVYSGVIARHPELPFLTHHGGGMVPQFPDRLVDLAADEVQTDAEALTDQLRTFYADTVLGATAALQNSIAFFGIDRIVFATDMPFGPPTLVRDRIADVDRLHLSEDDARRVFADNARLLLGLA
jgi:aminocarboxymuconate-semialdehyde decarboxylase